MTKNWLRITLAPSLMKWYVKKWGAVPVCKNGHPIRVGDAFYSKILRRQTGHQRVHYCNDCYDRLWEKYR